MSAAIPNIPLISTRPILRPSYVVTARALYDLVSFVEANAAELNRYYDELRTQDPLDFCSREEFAATQYECQLAIRGKYEHEARDEPRETRSTIDADSGMRRYGPID